MQTTHHTIRRHRLVVLAEIDVTDFLIKLTLRETLEEVSARISEEAWLDNQYAFNVGFDDIHSSCLPCLSVLIHVIVVLLVVARGDIVHPFLVVEIPTYGSFNAFLKLQAGLPSEFTLQLPAINGVAHIMAGSVGDVGDEVLIFALLTAEQTVDGLDDDMDDIDILPFVEAADVIGVGNLTLMEDEVNGACVVFDVEPVAYILALTIDGERLAVPDIVDE